MLRRIAALAGISGASVQCQNGRVLKCTRRNEFLREEENGSKSGRPVYTSLCQKVKMEIPAKRKLSPLQARHAS